MSNVVKTEIMPPQARDVKITQFKYKYFVTE